MSSYQLTFLVLVFFATTSSCDSAFLHKTPERKRANIAAGDPPFPPVNVTAEPGAAAITVDWEASQDATSFNVYWSASSNPRPESGAQQVTNATKPFVHVGLALGTTYYYVVTASNASGESDYSEEVSATPNPACSPNARPVNVAASYVDDSQIELTWGCDATDEEGFVLWRQELGGSWGELLRVGENATAAMDDNFAKDQRYRYRVTAYKDVCETVPSEMVEIWSEPFAPRNAAGQAISSTSVRLTWEDTNENETGYRVERQEGAGGYQEVDTVIATEETVELVDTALTPGIVYDYRVVAFNDEQDSVPAELQVRSSHDPQLDWNGEPYLAGGCELVALGTSALDDQPGLAAATIEGTISHTLVGTVQASLDGVSGFLTNPPTLGAIDMTWTVIDTYEGSFTLTLPVWLRSAARSVPTTWLPAASCFSAVRI